MQYIQQEVHSLQQEVRGRFREVQRRAREEPADEEAGTGASGGAWYVTCRIKRCHLS